jgi:hypothetical protein
MGAAKPGDVLRLDASIAGRLGNLIQARVTASLAGVPVLRAELTLSGQSPDPSEIPNPKSRSEFEI